MTAAPPRLRMFAGPNGSGKTTVKRKLQRPPAWFGLYINPDELEESIRTDGHISLRSFEFALTTEEV
jgi:predicted ABC-type ATPase